LPASRAFARHALVTLSALVASALPDLAMAGGLATVTAVPGVPSSKVCDGGGPVGCVLRRPDGHPLMLALPARVRSGHIDFVLRSKGTSTAMVLSVPTAGLVDTDFIFGLTGSPATGPMALGGDDVYVGPKGERIEALTAKHEALVLGLVDTDFVFGATGR